MFSVMYICMYVLYVLRSQGIVQYKNHSSTSSSIQEIDHLVESSMGKVKELCEERRRSFSGRPDLTGPDRT